MKIFKSGMAISLCVLSLFQAPAAFADKQDVGTLLGAIIGGIGANKASHGDAAATILGAVVFGIIGGEIGRSLDQEDQRELMRARGDCLERNHQSEWRGNGGYGSVNVIQDGYYANNNSMLCRSYESTIYSRGRSETTRGYACRDSYGNWSEVRETEITFSRPVYNNNQQVRDNRDNSDYYNARDNNDNRNYERPRYSNENINFLVCNPGYNRSAVLIDRRYNSQIANYSDFFSCQIAVENRRGASICIEGRNFSSYAIDLRTRQAVSYSFRSVRDCVRNMR